MLDGMVTPQQYLQFREMGVEHQGTEKGGSMGDGVIEESSRNDCHVKNQEN